MSSNATEAKRPLKIEIERRPDNDGFNVRVGDQYDDRGLNPEEALGCVVEFLYLERAHFYLKTQESWDAIEAHRAEIRERALLGNDEAGSVALTDPATTLAPPTEVSKV